MSSNLCHVQQDQRIATLPYTDRVQLRHNIESELFSASARGDSVFTEGLPRVQTARTAHSIASHQQYDAVGVDGNVKNSVWSSNIGRAFKARIRTSPLGRGLGRLAMEHDVANIPRAEANAILGVPDDDGFHSRDSYIEMAQLSWEYARQHMKRGEKLEFAGKHLAARSSTFSSLTPDRKSRPETMIGDKYMHLLDSEEGYRPYGLPSPASGPRNRPLPTESLSRDSAQISAVESRSAHELCESARHFSHVTHRPEVSSSHLGTAAAQQASRTRDVSFPSNTADGHREHLVLSLSETDRARIRPSGASVTVEDAPAIAFEEKKSSSLHFMKARVVSPGEDASPTTKRRSRNSQNRKTTVLFLNPSVLSVTPDVSSPPLPATARTMPTLGLSSHVRSRSQESSGQDYSESTGQPAHTRKRAKVDPAGNFAALESLPEIKRVSAFVLEQPVRTHEAAAQQSRMSETKPVHAGDVQREHDDDQNKWRSLKGRSFTSRDKAARSSRTVYPESSVSRPRRQAQDHGATIQCLRDTKHATGQYGTRYSRAARTSQADRLALGDLPIDWPPVAAGSSESGSAPRRPRRAAGEYSLFVARQSAKVRAEERVELLSRRR